jgi:predicted  nucleic acid-binding Zn-ribbon protein
MTDTPEYFPSRLDRIEQIILGLAERQANTQVQLDSLTENVNRVLARSAILDDVLLELRDSHEEHQRNFEIHQRNFEQHRQDFQEHQRTTNAALQSLEAILLQLTRNNS